MTFVPSLAQLGRHAMAAGYDADAVAWAAAVIAAGGTVSGTRKGLVDTLIKALKSAGLWTKLDRLWLFAAENQTAALIDLVARATATAVNSPGFTVDRGFNSDGSTSYVDTNYNPSTAGGNFALNAASFGGRSQASSGVATFLGSPGTSLALINLATSSFTAEINDATAITGSTPGYGRIGFCAVNRSGASARQTYYNGADVGDDTTASTSLLNADFYVLRRGSQYEGSAGIVASFFAGGSLTAADHLALYNAEHALMQAIGAAT